MTEVFLFIAFFLFIAGIRIKAHDDKIVKSTVFEQSEAKYDIQI